MKNSEALAKLYHSLNPNAEKIYVVPLIRFSHKKTDYLYLLYKNLIESEEFKIRSISIFDHFKLIAAILTNRNSILHYHWFEFQDFKSLIGMPWKLFCIYFFQKLGGTVVWTIHNEFPHDRKYLNLHLYLHQKMAKWSKALHVHCAKAVDIMSNRLMCDKEKFHVISHPEYPLDSIAKNEARDLLRTHYKVVLEDEEPILLMFGNISRYKRMDLVATLIIEFDLKCKLLIVGPIKKGNEKLYKKLGVYEQSDDRIKVIPHFIGEDRVSWFFSAADISVYNYREILSSSSYHMALAFNKAVLAPDIGCLSEEAEKTNVFLFKDQNELKDLIKHHAAETRKDDKA
ncbi:hypothetical protein ACKGJO_04175 [Gracilimonas sp. Q87]|uniref:hypothetical protein n=1 Tax=Gracilimonas sp. Q87 TaxID=3384766 RepID=UPI003984475B